jgi:hypothetical protein
MASTVSWGRVIVCALVVTGVRAVADDRIPPAPPHAVAPATPSPAAGVQTPTAPVASQPPAAATRPQAPAVPPPAVAAEPPAAASQPPAAQMPPTNDDGAKRLGKPFPAPVPPPAEPGPPPDVHVGVVSPQPSRVFDSNVHPGNQRRRFHGDPHQTDDDRPLSGMNEPAAPSD